jgi:hypothetical protein
VEDAFLSMLRGLFAAELEQLKGRYRRVVGGVEDPSVDPLRAQGADQGLGDVGVVDEVQSLVRRPITGPHQRLGEMRVTLPVHKGEAHDAQPQAVTILQDAQAVLGRRLARRVGPDRLEPVVLPCGTVSAWAVDEVRAREDEARDAGRERSAGQLERGQLVHRGRFLVGNAAKRGGEVYDRVEAFHGSANGVAVAKVADHDFGQGLLLRPCPRRVADEDAHRLAPFKQRSTKQGYLALQRAFPAASPEPAQIVIDGSVSSPDIRSAIEQLEGRLGDDDRFGPTSLQVNPAGDLGVLSVPLVGDLLGDRAVEAIRELRAEYIPTAFAGSGATVLVTGTTAENIDRFDVMSRWLPIVLVFVLGLSFLLLTLAFRSVVVAATAIALNLLSVGAAYGLLVLLSRMSRWCPSAAPSPPARYPGR